MSVVGARRLRNAGRRGCYPAVMARGWESKAIEAQQADAETTRRAGPLLTPEEQARKQQADSVALALADATAQLQAACRPVQRDALRHRVVALTDLLSELRGPRRP